MSWSAIRDKIKTVLESVPGIGVVHDRERWTTDNVKFKALFTSGGKVNGWILTRRAASESWLPGEATRTHVFLIKGFYGFADDDNSAAASETIVQNLVEAICDTFRAVPDLDDVCEISSAIGVRIEPVMFSGIMCHGVELTLQAIEQKQIG